MPSLMDLAFLLPVICVFVLLRGPGCLLRDGDTGWHIRTGEWILSQGHAPVRDMFSFSKAGQPWFAWEWGWDVCGAVIHGRWGLSGLAYANLLLLCLLSAVLYKLVRNSCRNDLLAFAITAGAVIGSTLHWLARPHLVSWLLLVLFAHGIDAAKQGRWRLFYSLPVVALIWANVHGSFFIGPLLLLLHAAQLLSIERKNRAGWQFVACGLACGLVSLVNPYGWKLHQHLAAYLLDTKQLNTISEYQPLNFHSPAAAFVEAFIVLSCLSMGWLVWRRRFAEGLWLGLWMHLGLRATRNVPLFLLIAAPSIAEMIQEAAHSERILGSRREVRAFFRAIAAAGQELRPFEAIPRFHLLSVGVLLVLAFTLSADFESTHFPVKAAAFLNRAAPANVLTSDAWGGYLIYRLYPQSHVFVDGRSDFYGASFDEGYVNLIEARHDWRQTLQKWPVDSVLLPVESPLASVLKMSDQWRTAYDDGVAVVFEPLAEHAR